MMTKATYCKFLQNLFKIDLHYSIKLFKGIIIKVLELETLRLFLFLFRWNNKREVI